MKQHKAGNGELPAGADVPTAGDVYSALLADHLRRGLDAKTNDARTAPGYAAAFDPEEAESLGAFAETALTEQDAIDSAADLPAAQV